MQQGDGDLTFRYNGDYKAQIYQSDGSYHYTSDRRLKKNFEPFDNVLEEVMMLKPKKFHMIDQEDSENKRIGFIAQEINSLYPSLVFYDPDEDVYSLNYSGLSTVAIAAIQDQQKIIESQKLQIESLENRIAKLESSESEIAELRTLVMAMQEHLGLMARQE